MTKSRKAYEAFASTLAAEQHRPFVAVGKALFLGFIAFDLIMGFMLGVVPLARGLYIGFLFHVAAPIQNWFNMMGWEGWVTALAINIGLGITIMYVCRNYLLLVARGVWMKAVDAKNAIFRALFKPAPAGPNVRPMPKPQPQAPVATPTAKAPPPPPRQYERDTSIVAG